MHATMLRVYRIMPCIEHPIGGSISAELHGKWNNFKSSFVSLRLAADVISFLRIAGPLHSAVFRSRSRTSSIIFACLVIISFLFGGSAFRIVTRRMTLEKLL